MMEGTTFSINLPSKLKGDPLVTSVGIGQQAAWPPFQMVAISVGDRETAG